MTQASPLLRTLPPLVAVLFAAGLLRGPPLSREAARSLELFGFRYDPGLVLFFLGIAAGQGLALWAIARMGLQKAILAALAVGGVLSAAAALAPGAELYLALRLAAGLALAPVATAAILALAGLSGERRWGAAMAVATSAWPLALAASPWLRDVVLGFQTGGLEAWRWPGFLTGLTCSLLALLGLRLWRQGLRPGAVLTPHEADALAIAQDEDRQRFPQSSLIARPLRDLRAWLWATAAFALGAGVLGVGLLAPGAGSEPGGWFTAAPWLAIAAGMVVSGQSSDVIGGRYWHVGLLAAMGGLCLAVAVTRGLPPDARFWMTLLSGFCAGGAMGSFWPILLRRFVSEMRPRGLAMAMTGGALGMAATGPMLAWMRLGGLPSIPGYMTANLLLLAAATMLCAASYDYRLDFEAKLRTSRR